MKVGDLVTLSAKGHSVQLNYTISGMVSLKPQPFGMIVSHDETEYYPYRVQWYGLPYDLPEWGKADTTKDTMRFRRYELKRLKLRSK